MAWWLRATLVAALSCVSMGLPAGAFAQDLPRIEEFYFDEDAATRPLATGVDPGSTGAIEQLLKLRERGGRNSESAEAQLAGMLVAGGRVDAGKAMYEDVLSRVDERSHQWRPVVFHYGWSLLRAGETEAALAQWNRLLANSGGRKPSWAPPTLALALWTLDRRDEAVRWYAAAVRTWPDRWAGTGQYAQLLPDWQESERETLAEVQAAWSEQRPAWP